MRVCRISAKRLRQRHRSLSFLGDQGEIQGGRPAALWESGPGKRWYSFGKGLRCDDGMEPGRPRKRGGCPVEEGSALGGRKADPVWVSLKGRNGTNWFFLYQACFFLLLLFLPNLFWAGRKPVSYDPKGENRVLLFWNAQAKYA